jgi:hypothetical protein
VVQAWIDFKTLGTKPQKKKLPIQEVLENKLAEILTSLLTRKYFSKKGENILYFPSADPQCQDNVIDDQLGNVVVTMENLKKTVFYSNSWPCTQRSQPSLVC